MSKHRAPLTIDAALARVAGQIPGGWPEMAKLLGKKEGIVRAWGDPDRRELIPLDCAITLDLAFQAAGGHGAPLHEVYTLKLELEYVTRFADAQALTHVLSSVIKETAEAESAMALASLPGTGQRQLRETVREIDEAVAAFGQARSVALRMINSEDPPVRPAGPP